MRTDSLLPAYELDVTHAPCAAAPCPTMAEHEGARGENEAAGTPAARPKGTILVLELYFLQGHEARSRDVRLKHNMHTPLAR